MGRVKRPVPAAWFDIHLQPEIWIHTVKAEEEMAVYGNLQDGCGLRLIPCRSGEARI
jgi:hypothetical protein